MKTKFLSSLLALLCSSALYALSVPHSGKVLETMNSGGYSYIKIDNKGKQHWIAVKQTEVKVGEKFSFHEQMWMKDFTSKTLNRTFDEILFAQNATQKQVEKPAWEMPVKKSDKIELKVDTQKGQIADILKNKDSLKDKSVTVKGKVTKVSRGIMKTSWVHIVDEYQNKLIFRAPKESVNVGDMVTAKGTLNTNVDYGYGYSYDAIVVDSTFSKN